MRHSLQSAFAAACLLSAPVIAAKTEATSWGKPGVSIDQYRTDAITCGRVGYYTDVSKTDAAKVFRDASGQLETNEADLTNATGPRIMDIVTRSARIVDSTRPQERMKDVGNLMQARIDHCLRGRGYTRFKLTATQRKHLEHLHLGSAERNVYLYGLATDPDVIKTQAF